jgi:hypothetical protein
MPTKYLFLWRNKSKLSQRANEFSVGKLSEIQEDNAILIPP